MRGKRAENDAPDTKRETRSLLRAFGIALAALLIMGIAFGRPYAIGAGVVMAGYAIHCVVVADRRGGKPERSLAQRQFMGVLLAFLAAFLIFWVALEAFRSFTNTECEAAEKSRTRRARDDRFAEVRSRAWLARRFGVAWLESCFAEDERSFESRGGHCQKWPLDDEPCRCGDSKWPEDARCGEKRAFCGCDPHAVGYVACPSATLHCVEP